MTSNETNTASLVCALLLTVSPWAAQGASASEHKLNIQRYTTTQITEAESDRVMSDATSVAQTNDGGGDVDCRITVERTGTIGSFSIGNGVVNSESDFLAIEALPGDIKVVNAINWCGKPLSALGCARVPGSSLVIVRYADSLEGILWLHEFAHNKGRNHRAGENFVMNSYITPTAKRLNSDECQALEQAPAAFQPAQQSRYARSDSASSSGSPAPIEEFVRRHYVRGIPYEEAIKYDSSDLQPVVDLLKDESQQVYWANAVGLIGMVGDQEHTELLIEFVKTSQDRQLTADQYRAALSAIIALGFRANKEGPDGEGFRYLSYLLLSPPGPTQPGTRGVEPAVREGLVLEPDVLTGSAVWGLAYSGQEQASALFEAHRSVLQFQTEEFAPARSSNVEEAKAVLEQLQEQSLQQFFEDPNR